MGVQGTRRAVHSLPPYAEHVLEEQPSTKVLPAGRREDGITSGEARSARSRPQASLVRPRPDSRKHRQNALLIWLYHWAQSEVSCELMTS